MHESVLGSTPQVSIIIPAYNSQKTITRCVHSIQANNDVSWEVILVDDGSRDHTGEICDKLAQEDPRIRVIHQNNSGPGMARNHGMDAARGTYLAFVDADDTVAETTYSSMILLAEKTGADVVVCNIDSILTNRTRHDCHVFGNQVIDGNQNVYDQIVIPLITTGHPHAALLGSGCNKLFRLSLLREHQLRFTTLRCAEDWLFSIECFKYAKCVAFTAQSLYQYDRTTEGSLSKTADPKSFENRVWIQHRLAELFPAKYTEDYLFLKILRLQQIDLNNHVDGAGWREFPAVSERIFRNKDLREVYQMPFPLPSEYRFAKHCVLNNRKIGYLFWSIWVTKHAFGKYLLRLIYRAFRK